MPPSQRAVAKFFAELEKSGHLARGLFRVIGGEKDLVRKHRQRSADDRRLLAHGLGREPRRRPVLGRAMSIEGDGRTQRAGLRPDPRMRGYAFALVEDADQAGCAMHIDRLADQPEWRRIGDAIDTDVIVAPEFEALPAAGLEGLAGKRLQFRFLVFGEQTGAGLRAAGA